MAENGRRPLGIVAYVCPYGMHIAPDALDRVAEENAAAAVGLEQAIDGPHAPIRIALADRDRRAAGPREATSFYHRGAIYEWFVQAAWPDPEDDERKRLLRA
jgi:hypothetical protein